MLLRKAELADINTIWSILQQAIERRRLDGSAQWQNGYPNPEVVRSDIDKGWGYVIMENETIIGYAAIIFEPDPDYVEIRGKWMTDGEYVVVHRVATSDAVVGKGVATNLFLMIEDLAKENHVFSIRVDTNFDNAPMLRIVEKLGYTFCGYVFVNGGERKAYEKVLE